MIRLGILDRACNIARGIGKWHLHQILATLPPALPVSSQQSRVCSSVSETSEVVPVGIIGAGPTGLVMSILLSQLGIRSQLYDAAPGPMPHPKAHFINHRTMEVFRTIPGLAAEVAAASPPFETWRRFLYCESLLGDTLGEIDHFPGATSPFNPHLSPEPVTHLAQDRLLRLLQRRAESYSLAKVSFNSEVERVQLCGEHVAVRVLDRAHGGRREQRFQYVIAADGANSHTREQHGVAMHGPQALQHLINIHFRSRELAQHLTAQRKAAMLYFVFNSSTVMVVVAHDLVEGEFVAQVPYYPPLQQLQEFTSDACCKLLRAGIGAPPTLRLEVVRVGAWRMDAQVAESYEVGGRLFLVGDAAHRFPPAGGFGMNTGIQDAHNLAWKLAAVLHGDAVPALLSSYQAERQPVAQANRDLSVSNWQEAMRAPAALGLDPRMASMLSSAATAASALLPRPAGAEAGALLLRAGLSLGLRTGGARGLMRAWRQKELTHVLQSGRTLRLQFPRHDLGFRFQMSGANRAGEHGNWGSAQCGGRLPHCSIAVIDGGAFAAALAGLEDCVMGMNDGTEVDSLSLLDLVAVCGRQLLLIVNGEVDEVTVAGRRAAGEFVQSGKVVLAKRVDDNHSSIRNEHVDIVFTASEERWREIGLRAATLVRSDGHICWMSEEVGNSGLIMSSLSLTASMT